MFVPSDFYVKFLVVIAVPPAVLLLAALFFYLPLSVRDRLDYNDEPAVVARRQDLRAKGFRLILFLLFLIYPMMSSRVLSLFVCRDVEGTSYLITDFTIECYDARWWRYIRVAIPMIVVPLPSLFHYSRRRLACLFFISLLSC